MREHAGSAIELGIARNFGTVDENVIATGEFGLDAKVVESFDDGFGEFFEILSVLLGFVGDEGEVEVAQVVIDGTPTG